MYNSRTLPSYPPPLPLSLPLSRLLHMYTHLLQLIFKYQIIIIIIIIIAVRSYKSVRAYTPNQLQILNLYDSYPLLISTYSIPGQSDSIPAGIQ